MFLIKLLEESLFGVTGPRCQSVLMEGNAYSTKLPMCELSSVVKTESVDRDGEYLEFSDEKSFYFKLWLKPGEKSQPTSRGKSEQGLFIQLGTGGNAQGHGTGDRRQAL